VQVVQHLPLQALNLLSHLAGLTLAAFPTISMARVSSLASLSRTLDNMLSPTLSAWHTASRLASAWQVPSMVDNASVETSWSEATLSPKTSVTCLARATQPKPVEAALP
jgi:hypothetical protein